MANNKISFKRLGLESLSTNGEVKPKALKVRMDLITGKIIQWENEKTTKTMSIQILEPFDVVGFEDAKRLKKLGFDRNCLNRWIFRKGVDPVLSCQSLWDMEQMYHALIEIYPAPSLSDIQKWLREEKNIEVCACADFDKCQPNGKWMAFHRNLSESISSTEFIDESKDTYEEALSSAIDEVLTMLEMEENN